MTITRRELVHRIGQAGGVGAAFVAMQGLGLFQADSAAAPLSLPRDAGKGTKIVILGAGMAGLVAAYELGKAGYECVILEARDRVGGRNWTVRRGTTIEMSDGTAQNCGFDEGLYFNSGPARLPSHHQAILGYCRELGVALEVEVNACRGAMVWNNVAAGQKPILMRQAINDMRGHVSELLAKAVNRGALDQELTPHDKERMVAFLKTYGDLSPDLFYQGSTRSGFSQTPGAGDQLGIANDPIDLGALLDADMWNGVLFEDIIDMQATMFQPVGGMDRIPAAFEKKLGPVVRRGCEVSEINRAGDGVEIVYREGKAGRTQAVAGDYCLCTIPLPVLSRIKADFSAPFRAAIAAVEYGNAVKIAWQARRFWETDDQIYGGISFVKGPTSLVWYPSAQLMSAQGVILGAYSAGLGGDADGVSARGLAEQFEMTRAVIEGLHPGRGKELRHPIGIAWSKVPFTLGIAARWKPEQDEVYKMLGEPDGPFYLAGEHLSHVGAWQEGAILSAHRAIGMIDQRNRALRAGRP
jgi:monoamine oxidase